MAHILYTSLFAVLVSTVGIASHASATPETAHTQAEHTTLQAQSCATVCLSGPAQSVKHKPTVFDEEDDDQPAPPYFLGFASYDIHHLHDKYNDFPALEGDGKVPKYRLCCVVRR